VILSIFGEGIGHKSLSRNCNSGIKPESQKGNYYFSANDTYSLNHRFSFYVERHRYLDGLIQETQYKMFHSKHILAATLHNVLRLLFVTFACALVHKLTPFSYAAYNKGYCIHADVLSIVGNIFFDKHGRIHDTNILSHLLPTSAYQTHLRVLFSGICDIFLFLLTYMFSLNLMIL